MGCLIPPLKKHEIDGARQNFLFRPSAENVSFAEGPKNIKKSKVTTKPLFLKGCRKCVHNTHPPRR